MLNAELKGIRNSQFAIGNSQLRNNPLRDLIKSNKLMQNLLVLIICSKDLIPYS